MGDLEELIAKVPIIIVGTDLWKVYFKWIRALISTARYREWKGESNSLLNCGAPSSNLNHMFYDCRKVKRMWKRIVQWISGLLGRLINLTFGTTVFLLSLRERAGNLLMFIILITLKELLRKWMVGSLHQISNILQQIPTFLK